MNWTETQIAQALDGRFYQLQQKSLGSFWVVDLNKRDEDEEPAPVVEVPIVQEVRFRTDRALWLDDIARAVCAEFGISRLELLSPRRNHHIVEARQTFFWIAKKHTAQSFPFIGLWCGGKDHTTVMHAVSKIDRQFARYSQNINKCLSRLGVSLNEKEAA